MGQSGEYDKPILANGSGSPQSIFQASTTRYHAIGTRAQTPDGRVFYYTRNTTASALNVGQIYVRADIVTNHENMATATNSLVVGKLIAEDVTLGATAAAAEAYRDGYLVVTDGGGEGHVYKVASHDAIASAGTGDIMLQAPIAVASDANTTVSLIKNAYDDPQISNTDQQDVLVGVPTFTIPAGNSTTQYGWLQTWGECAVLCDEAITTIGQAVVTGTGTAGAGEEDDTATTVSQEPIVGYNISPFVATEYQVVDLRIRP